ncbi:maleylpyruvate isomerase family mycothiol-dependent enzyme [Nonomuraea sp. NPDC050556]|uniref:maleylpyruvate isomerase family mycothiol-dependent enzyme n=1 Tax=Nonomuraea sp. NPDC050556 TaxID=3364369 RepID=UPI0037BBC445
MDIFDDLAAEYAQLDAVLSGLSDEQWSHPSAAEGWTIADVVLHLAQTEELAVASATGLALASLPKDTPPAGEAAPGESAEGAEVAGAAEGVEVAGSAENVGRTRGTGVAGNAEGVGAAEGAGDAGVAGNAGDVGGAEGAGGVGSAGGVGAVGGGEPAGSVEVAGALGTAGRVDAFAADLVAAQRDVPPAEILARWRAAATKSPAALRAHPKGVRLPWIAGSLSPATLATTRLAEHWAHAYDITKPLEIAYPDTERLRHIAWLGHRTLPYAFAVEGLEGGPVHADLTAPDGSHWHFGDPEAPSAIVGPAAEFCRVGARRLAGKDSTLKASGPYGKLALDVLRNYAF